MSMVHQQNVVELAAAATRTSTLTGSAVDLRDYEGVAHIVLMAEAGGGTSPTLDVKIQECATSGGSYTDVSGATFTQVTDGGDLTEMISLNVSELQRYVKVIGTKGGTTPSFAYGVAMLANAKQGRNASQSV